jgi:hypothetical protein
LLLDVRRHLIETEQRVSAGGHGALGVGAISQAA